jgi:FkbM family methyltransferase
MIVIYGAGELGKLAKQFLEDMKLSYIVIDDNPENYKDDTTWHNCSIIKIEDLCQVQKENYLFLICISTFSNNIIKQKLLNLGCKDIRLFYQFTEQYQKIKSHYITNGWRIKHPPKNIINNKYRDIELFFYDVYSRAHYVSFLNWHLNYIEDIHPDYSIICNNRYFIPEVINVLHDHETFVDVGAYDGRVTKNFIDIVENKYKFIYCFEPDLENYLKANNNLLNYKNISLSYVGLGNKKGYINFLPNKGYCSKFYKKSKCQEPITKLDYIKDIEPTFIKIHVEGYELEVLKGAINTIKQYRPIIAITTYHTEDGLYKIPLWLIKNCKDYNFYWRNHNYQGQGAVMYCIPKERNKNI